MTKIKELIAYLETLDPEAIVKVVEEGDDNFPKVKDLIIDPDMTNIFGNTDYYQPTLTAKPKVLTLGCAWSC